MNMGSLGQEDTSRMVKLTLDRRINFIDTADVYTLCLGRPRWPLCCRNVWASTSTRLHHPKTACVAARHQLDSPKVVVADVLKSDESGLHELETRHEDEATMVFGPLPKIDRERHAEVEMSAQERLEAAGRAGLRTSREPTSRRSNCADVDITTLKPHKMSVIVDSSD